MSRQSSGERLPPFPARTSGFFESLPLLVGAVALFLAGLVTWWSGLHLGPTIFPLWAVFVVAGFVVSIGVVLSWFFAEGSIYEGAPAASPKRDFPRSSTARTDLGRPRPDIASPPPRPVPPRAEPLAPWDEGPVPAERPSPPPAPIRERPVGDADTILDEIEEIQRALHPQRGQARDPPE